MNSVDMEKFQELQKYIKKMRDKNLTDEEFSYMNQQLKPYIYANALLYKMMRTEYMDLADEIHKTILELALALQRGEKNWQQCNQNQQRQVVDLYALIKKQEQEQHTNRNLFFKTAGDISAVVNTLAQNPLVQIGSTLVMILAGRLGETTFSTGMDRPELESLNRVDSSYILQSGINLLAGAQQFIFKKQQIELSDMKRILEAYGLKLDNLEKIPLEQVRKLVAKFRLNTAKTSEKQAANKNEGEMRTAEELQQEEKKIFFQHMDNAKKFFGKLKDLARQFPENKKLSENLQMVSIIGEKGIDIAGEVMGLAGLIPGVIAPVGIDMLFPMANIAMTAYSLISSLTRKKTPQEGASLQKALQIISRQISELRKEIHDRFNNVDKQLHKISKIIVEGFEQIEFITKFEFSDLRKIMQESLGRIETDINTLIDITRKGQTESAYMDYKKSCLRIEELLDDKNQEEMRKAFKSNVPLDIKGLEKNWLNYAFCNGIFSGIYHYENNQPYQQIAKIVNSNAGVVSLGYLATYAKNTLGIDIPNTALPNLDLWISGIELVIAARVRLKALYITDVACGELERVWEKTQQLQAFLDIIRKSSSILYQKLFSIYSGGLDGIEKIIIEQMVAKKQVEISKNESSISEINLSAIRPEKKDLSELNAQHLIAQLEKAQVTVPSILIHAQSLDLGKWEAVYASRNIREAAHGTGHLGDGWYLNHRHPREVAYDIQLNFKASTATIIPVLRVSFMKRLSSPSKQSGKTGTHHTESRIDDIEKTSNHWRNTENAIIVTSDVYWKDSALTGSISFDQGCAKQILEQLPIEYVITAAWNNAKLFGNAPNQKSSKENEEFMRVVKTLEPALFTNRVEQLRAARALSMAYADAIGFDEKLKQEIRDTLITDLKTFLDNPNLFRTKRRDVDKDKELLSRLSKSEKMKSIVDTKLNHIQGVIRTYDSFMKNVSGLYRDTLADPNLHEVFIDWNTISNVNVEKDTPLGEGGFGKVFKGIWRDKPVAVKMMHLSIDDDEDFKNEIEKAAEFNSPYVMPIYGYSKYQGKLCLVMELAERSLDKKLAHDKALGKKVSQEQQIMIILEIARGLKELHEKGIAHRDMKSLNILLYEDGRAKINDFGLAITTAKTSVKSTTQSRIKGGGSFLWSSPEAIEATCNINKEERKLIELLKDDIYSFGVIIWEIFSQSLPFSKFKNIYNPFALQFAIANFLRGNKKREDNEGMPPEAPAKIQELIRACWGTSNERPTAEQIVADLEKAFPQVRDKVQARWDAWNKTRFDGISHSLNGLNPNAYDLRNPLIYSSTAIPLANSASTLSNKFFPMPDTSSPVLSGAFVSNDREKFSGRSTSFSNIPNFSMNDRKQAKEYWVGVFQGRKVSFEEHQIARDGSCGFHTMGAERQAVVKLLLEHAKNPIARNMLAVEIKSVFMSGESNAITQVAKRLFQIKDECSTNSDNLQRKVNAIIKTQDPNARARNLDDLLQYFQQSANNKDPKLLAELQAMNKRSTECERNIDEYVRTEEAYIAYIESLLHREWLGIYSAKVYAYFKSMNLYIWIKDERNPGALTLKEFNIASNNQNTIHMLYTDGGTHFNLLSEFENDPKFTQSNAGYDKKEKYDRDSKDEKERQEFETPRIPRHNANFSAPINFSNASSSSSSCIPGYWAGKVEEKQNLNNNASSSSSSASTSNVTVGECTDSDNESQPTPKHGRK